MRAFAAAPKAATQLEAGAAPTPQVEARSPRTRAPHAFGLLDIHGESRGAPPVSVSLPTDADEIAADAVAERVMRSSAEPAAEAPPPADADGSNVVHRSCSACEDEERLRRSCNACRREEELQRSADGRTAVAGPSFAADLASARRRGGAPLGQGRAPFEQGIGRSFERVRVHHDGEAADLAKRIGARAFTVGNDVFFGENEFRPGTPGGDRLLAHELAHVAQQSRGPRSASVHRDVSVGGPPAGPSPAGTVTRIVVSCFDRVVVLETEAGDYAYNLSRCSAPVGTYSATVTVSGNDVSLGVPSLHGGFRAGFSVREGQENPTTLLRDRNGETVPLEVVDSLHLTPHSRGCMHTDPTAATQSIDLPAQAVLFQGDHRTFDLFPRWHMSQSLGSLTVPLGVLGWMDVGASADADVWGTLRAEYGDATLEGICFTRSRGNVLAGRAHLRMHGIRLQADVHAHGGLDISAKYLSVFRVASVDGGLDAHGYAEANADIDAFLEIERGHDGRIRPIGLFEVGLAAAAGFTLDANASLRVLRHTLWSGHWNLANARVDTSWHGGLRIDTGGMHVVPGSLERGTPRDHGQAQSMGISTTSGNATGGRGASDVPRSRRRSIMDILLALLRMRNGEPGDAVPSDFDVGRAGLRHGPVCADTGWTPQRVGRRVERVLAPQFVAQGANRYTFVPIPFGSKAPTRRVPTEPGRDRGEADLIEVASDDGHHRRVRVGEIKPMNNDGIADGVSDVAWYEEKIDAAGANCAEPRSSQGAPDRAFCDAIRGQGRVVEVDRDRPLAWTPSPPHFPLDFGRRSMRMFAAQIAPGVTGYECAGWVTDNQTGGTEGRGAGGDDGGAHSLPPPNPQAPSDQPPLPAPPTTSDRPALPAPTTPDTADQPPQPAAATPTTDVAP